MCKKIIRVAALFLITLFLVPWIHEIKASAASSVPLEKIRICIGKKEKIKKKLRKELKKAGKIEDIEKVVWISSDKNIAKVSKKGLVKGISRGVTTVTAKLGEEEWRWTVKVKRATRKATWDVEVKNAAMFQIRYFSDEITCRSKDESIAKVAVIESGYNVDERCNTADIMVYGIRDGETKIILSNNCNNEKTKYLVRVEKPSADDNQQKLIDHLLQQGVVNDLGDCVITEEYEENAAFAQIEYLAMDNDVQFHYGEVLDGTKVEWNMWKTVDREDEYTITLWIGEEFITTRVVPASYDGGSLVFEQGWFRIPVEEEIQTAANEISQRAYTRVEYLLLKEVQMRFQDLCPILSK